MSYVDEHGRTYPPNVGDERATVTAFLAYQRATFARKGAGLARAVLSAPVAPSDMTLGGMMKPLALVEDHWFGHWLWGEPYSAPFDPVNFDDDPAWEWRTGGAT